MLTALLFTLWPLARARDIRAAELFRDLTAARRALAAPGLCRRHRRRSPRRWSRAPPCSPARPSSRSATAGGVAGALLVLLAAAWGLRRARPPARARRARPRPPGAALGAWPRSAGRRARPPRWCSPSGSGSACWPRSARSTGTCANLVTRDLPERAPAFFFVDIQNDQLAGFLARAEAVPGVEAIETAPMLRGIITRINGRAGARGRRPALGAERRPRRHLCRAPAGGHGHHRGRVVAGGLRRPAADELRRRGGPRARPEARRQADRQHPRPRPDGDDRELPRGAVRDDGDQLPDHARPGGARRRAAHPHRHRLCRARRPRRRCCAPSPDAYPNITAVGVREAIDRVATALEGIGAASRWAAAATLLTGFMVLIGAAAAGERRRVFEAAVLKTLGADRAAHPRELRRCARR